MMRVLSFVVAPEAPASVTATATTVGCAAADHCVRLDWTSVAPTNASNFRLEVSVNGGAFSKLETVGDVRTYLHTGLVLNNSYQYQITADNTVGYTKAYAAPAAGYPVVTSSSAPVLAGPVLIQ